MSLDIQMRCRKCRYPLPSREVAAYRVICEDCWADMFAKKKGERKHRVRVDNASATLQNLIQSLYRDSQGAS